MGSMVRSDDGVPVRRAADPLRLGLLLLVMVVVDLLLVAANAAHHRGIDPFTGWRWDLGFDAGWAEVWRGAKLLVAAAYLLRLQEHLPRAPVLGAWALTLTVMVFDDLLRFHEDLGSWFATSLGLPTVAGLRPQDLGEVLAWGVLVAPLGAALVAAFLRSSPVARRTGLVVGAAVTVIVVFAVGLDLLAVALAADLGDRLYHWTSLLEVVGELVGAGLVLVTALWLWGRRPGAVDRTRAVASRSSADVPVP